MGWFNRKKDLTPGTCECSHSKCYHEKGKGKCQIQSIMLTEEGIRPVTCACATFVKGEGKQIDKELEELRKIAGLAHVD